MKRWFPWVMMILFSFHVSYASFQDIGEDVYLQEAAQFLQIRGGLDARRHLLPTVKVTRVAFLKMLLAPVTLSSFDQERVERVSLAFTDIEPYAWYIPHLKKAVFLGLIVNTPTPFHPNDTLHRGDALQFTLQAYGLPQAYLNTNIDRAYVDVFADSRYKLTVAQAQKYQLVEPYSERIFGVFRPVTREDAVRLIYRAHQVQQTLATALKNPKTTDELPVITIDTSVAESFDGWNGELYRLVLQQIEEQYLFADEIDYEALAYGAVQGMVKALGDPYTEFLPPVEAESFDVSLGSQVEGIGTYVQGVDLGLRIDAIIPGTPAEGAGLRVGDIMFSANGESLKGMSSSKAASKIRGAKGTTVILEVLREGVTLTFEVVRDAFAVTSIEQKNIHEEYVLRIADFRDSTGAEFATYVDDILKKNPKRLVLDLRDNGGGYLSASVQILRYFAKEGELLVQLDYGKQGIEDYEAQENGVLSDLSVVVLVNKNTASAAEILAGTLQDYGRAKLVGEVTYGKGTVQGIIDFTDNSSLKVTVGRWLTGGGRWVNNWEHANNVEQKGLVPDVAVERTKKDRPQEEVLEELQEQENTYEQDLFDAVRAL